MSGEWKVSNRAVLLRRALTWLLTACGACVPSQAVSAALTSALWPYKLVSVDTGYLRIEWPATLLTPPEKNKDSLTPKAVAAKACAALGTALTAGKGLWGQGLFTDFGCYLMDTKDQASLFAGHEGPPRPAWTLSVHHDRRVLQFDTIYAPPGETQQSPQMTTSTMPLTAWTQDLLREHVYAALTAALILDAMPATTRLTLNSPASAGQVDLPLGSVPEVASLRPKSLPVYTLAFAPKDQLWLPHIVGNAALSGTGSKRYWRLILQEVPADITLYAHSADGPGAHTAAIQKQLATRQKVLLNDPRSPGFAEIREGVATAARFLLLNTVDSGYVGLRIGRELLNAGAIIPPATIIGAIGEVRSGYLSGLRVYYDLVPRHGSTVNDEALWVGWSRLVGGYNFGLKVPWVIDRLELAPKVGIWNVNSRLPELNAQGGISYRDFSLNNALSLGVEGGAVWERTNYLLRLWVARDVSVPLSKAAGVESTVESVRVGVDALLKGQPISLFQKAWRLSYLVFLYHEDLTFKQQSNAAGPFTLEFSSSYAGAGLSLAW